MRRLTLLLALMLGACSYNVSTVKTYDSTGVKRLYDLPQNVEYTNLGLQAWGFYRPGFTSPRLADVWDDLSEKVRAMGGNACVVRHEDASGLTARTLEVTCEVLRIET